MRMLGELDYWPGASFTTLTFDDDHLPDDLSVKKEHLQLFFKRLRKEKVKFSYYAVGEYGGIFERPHYHIIFFGPTFESRNDPKLNKTWPNGFNDSRVVNYSTCTYVAKYCIEKITGQMQKSYYGDREPPFQLQSKGLGLRWAQDHLKDLIDGKNLTIGGRSVGLPAYYKRKFDIDTSYLSAQKKLDHLSNIMDEIKELDIKDKMLEIKRIEAWRIREKERIVNARMNQIK